MHKAREEMYIHGYTQMFGARYPQGARSKASYSLSSGYNLSLVVCI